MSSDGGPNPFGSWNGVEAFELHEGVSLHAIGGDQVLLCRVTYAPGKQAPPHTHEHTEQVMAIIAGEVELTVEGKTSSLCTGDVACVNRGLEHALYSENGVTFFEALAPVPLDHVPDGERDLVLGSEQGRHHVER